MLLYEKIKSGGNVLTAETVARCDKVYVNLAEAAKADWNKINDMSENYEVFVQDAVTSLGSYIGISVCKFSVSALDMTEHDIPTVYVENSGPDNYYTEYFLYINNTDAAISVAGEEYIGIEEVPAGKAALVMYDNSDGTERLIKMFNNNEMVEIPNVSIKGDLDATKTEENTELLQYVSNFVSLTPFGYSKCIYGTTGNIPQDADNEVVFVTADGEDITEYLYDKSSKYAIKTNEGKLILVDEDAPDGIEFFGMVDDVVVVGKAAEAEIVLNDIDHMHFAIDSERPYVIGQAITLRAIPDDEWMISPLDDENVYAVINGERFIMELNPDNTWSVEFVINSGLVEIELDGKVEYDQE